MDMDTLTTLISNFGFPIIACLYMARYVTKQANAHTEQMEKLQEDYKEKIAEVTTALNNNTLVIQKLCDRMEG